MNIDPRECFLSIYDWYTPDLAVFRDVKYAYQLRFFENSSNSSEQNAENAVCHILNVRGFSVLSFEYDKSVTHQCLDGSCVEEGNLFLDFTVGEVVLKPINADAVCFVS